MAKIIAVCMSEKKGTKKGIVPEGILKENFGLLGDAHADSQTHRQVSLLAIESIARMNVQGLDVGPGDFAENLSTEGIELFSLPVGTKLSIGEEAVLEVTQIGKECHTRCAIYYQAGTCVMPTEGIFTRVIRGGRVKAGDPITPIRHVGDKLKELKQILTNMQSVLIAYSGGVDSTFLLKVAQEVLGDKVLAVTELSPVYPSEETGQAKTLAQEFGVRHEFLETQELSNSEFVNNPKDRCYWCKKELFTDLLKIAQKNNLNYVLDGTNFDDLDDFRPGMRAASELGVRSPLKEARFTKDEIRRFSKKLGLPTWNKPSFACLASRFPYGMKISKENLDKVDKAERFLRNSGITQVRVRQHDNIARIEVLEDELPKLMEPQLRKQLIRYFKQLGYAYITVDLEGYRSGSMNEVLKEIGNDEKNIS